MQAIIIRGYDAQTKYQFRPSYQKPVALNWRYQIPGESYEGERANTRNYSAPKAINWRWQVEK